MEIAEEIVDCEQWNKKFKVVKFGFDIHQDSELINNFKIEGEALARRLNGTLARDSSRTRDFDTLKANAIAGVISEFVWRHYLRDFIDKEGLSLSIKEAPLTDLRNQIDIIVVYPDRSSKTIEVRSSFPYTGIKNGICRVFDMLGWYANEVKTMEVRKDYYVRCLFPYKTSDFLNILGNKFDAYLTGGATRAMLETSEYARDKEFIPYDEMVQENIKMTKYRVIEPIINAQDTRAICGSVINGL